MKKIEYKAPELEIIKLNNKAVLLAGSGEEQEEIGGGAGAD